MTRRTLALPILAAALGLTAPAAATEPCTAAFQYAVTHNPWKPLPQGGGGGEPGGAPMPGQPTRWAQWNQAAATELAKCLAS